MIEPKCAKCKLKPCSQGIEDESLLPAFCPLKTSKNLIEEIKRKYQTEEIKNFYIQSALTEKEAYDEKQAREKGITILSLFSGL